MVNCWAWCIGGTEVSGEAARWDDEEVDAVCSQQDVEPSTAADHRQLYLRQIGRHEAHHVSPHQSIWLPSKLLSPNIFHLLDANIVGSKTPNLTSLTILFKGMGAILARCRSCCHQWLTVSWTLVCSVQVWCLNHWTMAATAVGSKNISNGKALRETQTLLAGCSKAEPKIFALPQTPSRGRRMVKT